MIKVDDLVEPRPEEIALSGLPTFFRPHESPRRRPQAARESRPARRINLPENLSTTAETRQIGLLRTARKLQPIRGLGVLHGRPSGLLHGHRGLTRARTVVRQTLTVTRCRKGQSRPRDDDAEFVGA